MEKNDIKKRENINKKMCEINKRIALTKIEILKKSQNRIILCPC